MIASERFGDLESLPRCPVGQLVAHVGYPDEDVASQEMAGILEILETAGGQLGQEARLVEAVFGGVLQQGAINPAVEGGRSDLFEVEAAAGLEDAGDLGNGGLPVGDAVQDAEVEDGVEGTVRKREAFGGPATKDAPGRLARGRRRKSRSMAQTWAAPNRSIRIPTPAPRPQPISSTRPPSTGPPSSKRSEASKRRCTSDRTGLSTSRRSTQLRVMRAP